MAGFSSVDSVINAVSNNNKLQKVMFNKLMRSTTVAATPHTLWLGSGYPGSGVAPVGGYAGGSTLGSATPGALYLKNTTTGSTTNHLVSFGGTASAAGVLYLCDRLAHCGLAHAQASGSFSPVLDGTGRLASGEGAMMMLEVTTALSAASNSINITYTNQDGVTKTTPNIATVASAVIDRVPYASYTFIPLAAGDRGVRTIVNYTLASGTATGSYNLVLTKPIAQIPITSAQLWSDRDFVVELPSLPRIYDNSCLYFIYVPATAATHWLLGEVRVAEN
jgi:hypothetical protein